MQPINYLGMVPQQDFLRDIQGGLQIGMGIRAAQQAQQQQEAAQQRQQQYQQAVQSYLQKPSVSGASALSLQFPERAKEIKDAWEMEDKTQRESTIKAALPFFSALNNGRSDLAQSLLKQRVAALQNSGQDASHEEGWLEQIKGGGADVVKGQLGLFLSAVHPEFSKNFAAMGAEQRAADMAPVQLDKTKAEARKAGAEATTAEATAANAPTAVKLGNQEIAEKIQTAQANRRIAELDVQIKQANSETDRGRLQLERDKLVSEQSAKQQATGQGAQDQIDTITTALDTVNSVMKHPGLSKGTGMGGDVLSWFNGTDAADFRAQVATLKSQQFMAAAANMKGMGALSDAEGARLEKAIASLDTSQSPEQFKTALGVIRSTLTKAQAKVVASGKAPTSGGAAVVSHPTYKTVTDGDINRVLKQYPGATREQVMQFLKQGGAEGGY